MPRNVVLTVLLVLASACATTSESVDMDSADGRVSQECFDRISSLAGEWTGQGGGGEQATAIEARYRITAAGSAVEETLSPGTEHEMVTMYHMDGGRLMMTHYCSAGNQPRMIGKAHGPMNGDVQTIRFEFADATNLASPDVPHMHAMEMILEGKDHLKTHWTYFIGGKPAEEARFDFKRKSGAAMPVPARGA